MADNEAKDVPLHNPLSDEGALEDLNVKKQEDELWDNENTATKEDNDNHPLEEAPYENIDPWAQQESSLLNDQEDSNANRDDDDKANIPVPTIITTPAAQVQAERHQSLDADVSHSKGFFNAEDSNEIVDLEVTGTLPSWLSCEFFTVGPGTFDIKYMRKVEIDGVLQNVTKIYTFGHWFDGLPMVNRFDLHGQRNSITYRNRLTCRRLIEKIRDNHGYAPRHPAGLFKSSTNQTVLTKFLKTGTKASKPDAEPCGARVLPSIPGLDGRVFCLNFANHIQELDPFDLKPTRVMCWNEINPAFKGYSSCPNGQIDGRTGEYINFTMDVGYQSTKYHFFSISDRNPKGSVIGSVTAPASFVNSFSVTPKYIILAIFPLLANTAGVKFSWNESILESFTFNPSEPTLFYVISRETGQHIATYRSDPCFAFHHVNAFEDDRDNVYVDMICYHDDTIAHQLTTENLRNPNSMNPPRLASSELRRYVLHTVSYSGGNKRASGGSRLSGIFRRSTASGAGGGGSYAWMPEASYDRWLQPSLELPQVNPNYKMHSYTFLYGLGFSAVSSIIDGKIWDSIIKADVSNRSVLAIWHEENCYPSEAVFVPRPPGPENEVAEDDGVLLSVVLDAARGKSFLLVLDAATLTVLAKAYLDTIVPLSFGHGSYRLQTY